MKSLIKNKDWKINKEYNKEKLLYLLTDRPNYVSKNIDFYWLNNKKQEHREYDLPAIIGKNGYLSWRKNSKFHREDGKPAMIYKDGFKKYWLNDKRIKTEHLK